MSAQGSPMASSLVSWQIPKCWKINGYVVVASICATDFVNSSLLQWEWTCIRMLKASQSRVPLLDESSRKSDGACWVGVGTCKSCLAFPLLLLLLPGRDLKWAPSTSWKVKTRRRLHRRRQTHPRKLASNKLITFRSSHNPNRQSLISSITHTLTLRMSTRKRSCAR